METAGENNTNKSKYFGRGRYPDLNPELNPTYPLTLIVTILAIPTVLCYSTVDVIVNSALTDPVKNV